MPPLSAATPGVYLHAHFTVSEEKEKQQAAVEAPASKGTRINIHSAVCACVCVCVCQRVDTDLQAAGRRRADVTNSCRQCCDGSHLGDYLKIADASLNM